jgi:hypothetical protein
MQVLVLIDITLAKIDEPENPHFMRPISTCISRSGLSAVALVACVACLLAVFPHPGRVGQALPGPGPRDTLTVAVTVDARC